MVVKVGVIGTGAMGRAHIDRLTNVLTGAKVVAVTDINQEAAKAAVRDFKLDAKVYPDDTSLLQDPDIDAVFVVSFGGAHEATVLKALDTDKFIFTEKPLATTLEGAKRIVDKEMGKPRKVIQVGFMRRYDEGIHALKTQLDSGIIGTPLVVRASHINPDVAANYSNEMAITDTLIHEIDEMHWLLDDDYASIQITSPRQSSKVNNDGLRDPQLATLTTKKGVVIQVLVHVTAQYGYEVKLEVVGETGELKLPDYGFAPIVRTQATQQTAMETSWVKRFLQAYNTEVQEFIDQVAKNESPIGPSAWDGYIAAVTAEAGIRSQKDQEPVLINVAATPAFYQKKQAVKA